MMRGKKLLDDGFAPGLPPVHVDCTLRCRDVLQPPTQVTRSATVQLITMVGNLTQSGEIGDGYVAQLRDLAERARVEQGMPGWGIN